MALFVVLIFLLLLFLLLRILYDHVWDRGLSTRISFEEEYLTEGERSHLSEVVVNDKLLPLPVVEIDFHMDKRLQFSDDQNNSVSDRTYRRDVFALGIRQKITRTLEFKCVGRGYFRIDEASVNAQDLFLMRKYGKNFSQNTEFYVLPRPVSAHEVRIPYSQIMGELISRKKIYDDPFEFAGLREYTRSDPMKYINWKATARAGKLLVNLHESTLSQRVIFLLDMEGAGVQQADLLNEAGVRLVCTLCSRLLYESIEVGIFSNGRDVLTGKAFSLPQAAGAQSELLLKKALARVEAQNGLAPITAFFPWEEKGDETLFVLVSRRQEPELAEEFSRLVGKEKGIWLIPYRDEKKEGLLHSNTDTLWIEV